MGVAQRLYFTELASPQPDDRPLVFGAPLEFTAEVTDIREDSRREARQLWQLALDRTAFYPGGGGQPSDLGRLEAVARSGARLEVPVLLVEQDDAGEIWHFVEKPLAAGTRITGFVDAARRQDHAQQHTGQHLLSAVFLRELGAPTISFHLGQEASTIDLADLAPETLPASAIERVEAEVNRLIAANVPVRAQWIEGPQAEAMLARGELRKLPERSGPMRLVEITGLEFNACGGTHVTHTGEIGGLTLRGLERVRGALRFEFCCGLRAMRSARADFEHLAVAARLLSVGASDLPARLAQLLEELKSRGKEHKILLEEMAGMEARLVLLGAGGAGTAGLMEVLLVEREIAYAKLVAARIVAEADAAVVIVAATKMNGATLILACGVRSDVDCGQTMRSAMTAVGGRGGGSADMAQGSVALELLEDAVRALRHLAGF